MNIGLTISGNLTGFSRFYANDEAKKLLNTIKFNFDVHNLVSFLNNSEKLYAVFFSTDVVAVSLITNILDSFRRPGNLVVTVLIPRGHKIVDGISESGTNALYHLLNEINDKFYERNFLNGMVNQNPAVLMQDYYTEILSKFKLEPDRSQRKINGLIDITAPNKRIGYISALERSIPSYLSALFRKSYEGYHYIFFASNAPQNIAEPAEEIVTYRVKIDNKDKIVPGEVKLSDKIPFISKSLGDKDLPTQDFTYEQVISGEAAPYITGVRTDGENIILNYNFPKEEKTINFKFYDGINELPIHIIRPKIESNGISSQLQTNTCLFKGKEIYEPKTIKSGVSEYTIERGSSDIDLQRVPDGETINIYVSKVWTWTFDPMINDRQVTIKPISITLVNIITGDKKKLPRVTGYVTERLTGSAQDWEMHIESDYYKSAIFPALGPYRLEYKPQSTPVTHGGSNGGNGATVKRNGEGTRTHGNSSSKQGLKFTNGQSNNAKEAACLKEEQKKRFIKYGAYALVLVICFVGGWFGFTIWDKNRDKKDIVEPDSSWTTNHVVFSLEDGSKNRPEIVSDNLALLDFTVSSNSVKIEDGENVYSKEITFDPKNSTDSIIIKVSFNKTTEGIPIIFAFKKYAVNELREGPNPVILSVKNSELDSYRSLAAGTIPAELATQVARLSDGDKDMRAYAMLLVNLKKEIDVKTKADADAKAKAEAKVNADADAKANADVKAAGEQINRFGDTSLILGKDKETFYSGNNKIEPKPHEEARANDLRSVMKLLYSGEIPSSSPRSLTQEQQNIINKLRNLSKQTTKSGKLRSTLKDKKKAGSLHRIQVNIISKEEDFL